MENRRKREAKMEFRQYLLKYIAYFFIFYIVANQIKNRE